MRATTKHLQSSVGNYSQWLFAPLPSQRQNNFGQIIISPITFTLTVDRQQTLK